MPTKAHITVPLFEADVNKEIKSLNRLDNICRFSINTMT